MKRRATHFRVYHPRSRRCSSVAAFSCAFATRSASCFWNRKSCRFLASTMAAATFGSVCTQNWCATSMAAWMGASSSPATAAVIPSSTLRERKPTRATFAFSMTSSSFAYAGRCSPSNFLSSSAWRRASARPSTSSRWTALSIARAQCSQPIVCTSVLASSSWRGRNTWCADRAARIDFSACASAASIAFVSGLPGLAFLAAAIAALTERTARMSTRNSLRSIILRAQRCSSSTEPVIAASRSRSRHMRPLLLRTNTLVLPTSAPPRSAIESPSVAAARSSTFWQTSFCSGSGLPLTAA